MNKLKDKFNNYSAMLNGEYYSSKATFKIFTDFFNQLNQKKATQKKYKMKMSGLFLGSRFVSTIDLHSSIGLKRIFFEFEGMLVCATFDVFKENGSLHHYVFISSNKDTEIKTQFVYDYILTAAIKECELKGKYITLNPDFIDWKISELEKRSFDDIFLPKILMDDLKLYGDVFSMNEELLRYLFVGIPGTGKTEATLVIANHLMKKGVTIIKTKVGDYFKYNMELAEILAPSLVLLDDVDIKIGSRNNRTQTSYLDDFLDVLDGTDKLGKNVGIIAATNSSDLLDMAAQRPGRFDKIVLFDDIEKDNIKKIIQKSLKYNFGIKDNESLSKTVSDNKIVKLYHNSSVTGSHIYNSVNILLKKHGTLCQDKKVCVDWLLKEIEDELTTLNKIRLKKNITATFEKKTKRLGFDIENEDESKEMEDEIGEPSVTHRNPSRRHEKRHND